MGIDLENLKQGSISSLFPNLHIQVIANGVLCEIISASDQQVYCRVIDPFKNVTYPIGAQFYVSSFLIGSFTDDKNTRNER
mgnify:CR=1 FL=1